MCVCCRVREKEQKRDRKGEKRNRKETKDTKPVVARERKGTEHARDSLIAFCIFGYCSRWETVEGCDFFLFF